MSTDRHATITASSDDICTVPSLSTAPDALSDVVLIVAPQSLSCSSAVAEATSPSVQERSKLRTWSILLALYLSLFIGALDATIVSTALPVITSHLHSAAGYAWIGGAYILALAATAPIWAGLSDIWGRKAILLLAIALFFCSSIACGASVSMPMLIASRAVQGSAGGGLVLLVNIVISDMFDLRQRSLYLGYCEVIWAVAGAAGPVLGGALAQKVSWRWIWLINLPAAAASFVVTAVFLDVHNPHTNLREGIMVFDWSGTISLLAMVLLVLLGLDFGGETFPWTSPKVLCLILVGTFVSLFFVVNERKVARLPLLPPRLFKSASSVACFGLAFAHGIAMMGAEYYLPLVFQSVLSPPAAPLRSGLLSLPFIFTEALSGVACGVYVHRFGRYASLTFVGALLMTLGYGLFISLSPSANLHLVIWSQLIAGFGSGLLLVPPLLALQASVDQDDNAAAAGAFSFVRNIAQAISVIFGALIFKHSMDAPAQQSKLRKLGIPANVLAKFQGREAAANVDALRHIADDQTRKTVQSVYYFSTRNMWIFYTGVTACCIVAAIIARKEISLDREFVETRTGITKRIANVADTELQQVAAMARQN